jgi:glycosyltransferase involved in cell wall biosynthesis
MINLVTVCRIVFSHKGLDRGLRAVKRLFDEGMATGLRWYIIGDGPDLAKLENMIRQYRLEGSVILLGKKINPFPYILSMDLFFLPSLYEGKPMAVTEAMILGIPAMVCNYASAADQIKNGIDGIIIDNNDEAIYKGLKDMIMEPELIKKIKAGVMGHDYSNMREMDKVNRIIEGSINDTMEDIIW